MRLANHPVEHHDSFCLSWFYDYDIEYLSAVAKDLGLGNIMVDPFIRRLQKVCRRLEAVGILSGCISSCHKEYIGEPSVLKSYCFSDAGYAFRLAPEKWPHYKPMGRVEVELELFLDRAFPSDE
jgi:hypothetical protein